LAQQLPKWLPEQQHRGPRATQEGYGQFDRVLESTAQQLSSDEVRSARFFLRSANAKAEA